MKLITEMTENVVNYEDGNSAMEYGEETPMEYADTDGRWWYYVMNK